ncbi:unnamed protein product [Ceutorhynchus assimilis]|uniref:Uncharacterized protein n=1 Tax=Ceutorhynchus assimilis TaxID=467358 RepID=A0A9N9QNW3_9CUCU|nr:unnamed protein product [Ceutorhynchus assimilis]
MSTSPSNVAKDNEQLPIGDKSKSSDKRKLLLSQSEDNLSRQQNSKDKRLGKVKSLISKDQLNNPSVTFELDLARSMSQTTESDSLSSNLSRARDSLEYILKDEQNMPKSRLEKSIFQHKPKNIPNSPKSSPQLGQNSKATTSKLPFWDTYDRKGKKNKKDISKNQQSPRSEGNIISKKDKKSLVIDKEAHGNQPDEAKTTDEAMGESYKFKYLPKNSKSVVFTNEVFVVYFNNEHVIGEEKEPLKKDVEQQTRNREMRRVHLTKYKEKHNLCLF